MLVFHLVFWVSVPVWQESDPLRKYTTNAVSFLLTALGIANRASGNTIFLRNDTWIVTHECTAINVLILFVSFVGAYTASFRAKLRALIIGVPFIIAANLGRLVTLGLLTEYSPGYADFFHDYVWETLFLFLVVGLWLIWIELVVKREGNISISR